MICRWPSRRTLLRQAQPSRTTSPRGTGSASTTRLRRGPTDRVERVRWGIAVNVLGFAIWAYSTAALNIALGQILPGTALEWTLVLFSGWALYRTGLKRELVTV